MYFNGHKTFLIESGEFTLALIFMDFFGKSVEFRKNPLPSKAHGLEGEMSSLSLGS